MFTLGKVTIMYILIIGAVIIMAALAAAFVIVFIELHFAAGEFPSSCKITVLIDKMTLNGIIVNNKQKQRNNTD